jgi:hypothetical protein
MKVPFVSPQEKIKQKRGLPPSPKKTGHAEGFKPFIKKEASTQSTKNQCITNKKIMTSCSDVANNIFTSTHS